MARRGVQGSDVAALLVVDAPQGLANLKGDESVSYSNNCKNNSIIYDNDGLISNLVVKDTISFINQNPMLVIKLIDFEGNFIPNKKIRIYLTDSKGQDRLYSLFTNNHGIALFEEAISIDNYTFSVIHDGNDIYKPSQVLNKKLDVIYMSTSLVASDINTYYNVPIVIKATLKGKGNVLLDDKIVHITVNGKTRLFYSTGIRKFCRTVSRRSPGPPILNRNGIRPDTESDRNGQLQDHRRQSHTGDRCTRRRRTRLRRTSRQRSRNETPRQVFSRDDQPRGQDPGASAEFEELSRSVMYCYMQCIVL